MAIINVPANVRFTDVEIWNEAVSEGLSSPFTGAEQILKRPFDPWYFRGDLVPLDRMDAGAVKSFLMQLAGRVNSFRLPVPGSKYPISNYVGVEGTLKTSGDVGVVIEAVGFTGSSVVVKNGDMFNIGDELKVATRDCSSTSGGAIDLYFMPPMRNSYLAGTPIKIREPFVLLSSVRDDVAKWTIKPPIRHGFKLDCKEPI